MRSPASAIAWELQRRYLWALIAVIGYLLVLGAVNVLILGSLAEPVTLDPPDGRAGAAIAPLSTTFLYFLAVFSFGLQGDLGGRASLYPARMFTLPVTTKALAGWPMVHGGVVMAILWLFAALCARWPWGIDLPLIWPALLGAVFLAWTQVLTWMPYGLPGLRVIFAVVWLMSLDAIVILAVHYKASESQMIALLLPQLPLAYLAACFAVARARRGHVPDWRGIFSRRGQLADVLKRQHRFPSPADAQLWFEWRLHGRSLPTLVAMVLPFELALLFVFRHEPPVLTSLTLLSVLVTPPFMAGFVAATIGKANPAARDSYGVAPFLATRPLTSAALIAPRLKVAIGSTLATWLLVLIATTLGLALSGTSSVVVTRVHEIAKVMGMPRAIVLGLLLALGLMASTWKQLAQNLYIGLSGREWVVKSSVFLTLSLLVVVIPTLQWIHDSRVGLAGLLTALPWILAALVCLKMCVAAWIAIRLYDGRLLSDQTLVKGAACWLFAVLALYGVLVWFVDTPLIARYFLLLIAILAIPLARLSAAPLALAWNRHR